MELRDLTGLIPHEVGEALAYHAAHVDPSRAIVEIGSFKGKSTCYLASGAEMGAGARVWAVDPWDSPGNITGRFGYADPATHKAFLEQIRNAGYEDRITPLKMFSDEAAASWTGPEVGMLYIDGDHTAESIRRDFKAWEKHLANGAIVAFDDCDTPRNPGVREVVDELDETLHCHIEAERLAVGRWYDA